MEKIKEFLKNKAIGYYIAMATAFLSLVLAIVFFATFSNPALDPIGHVNPMGNKAAGLSPETIGIFLIAGFVIELIVLTLPQYRFVHVIAIIMFGLALYKEILIIPDFLAGKANNVMYNGGNYDLNMFYLVMLLIIAIASVTATFFGFYKSETYSKEKMKVSGMAQIVTVSVAGIVVIAAVLSSTLISSNLGSKASRANDNVVSSSSEEVAPKPKFDPITDEIRAAAAAADYTFDPNSVVIKQQEKYEFSAPSATAENPGYYNADLAGLSYSATRAGHNLVYLFEGEYSEGYQGQYNTYLTGMYLWDDGLFTGKSNSTEFKGYWYNSSLTSPDDDPETEENESLDCVNMVSNTSHFESIIADVPMGGAADFYERQCYVYMHPGWGDGRSVVVSGYKYYPDVAAFIDTNGNEEMKVGEKFRANSTWFFDKVIKNLKYTQIVPTTDITWTLPEGMVDANNKLVGAGEYQIKAKWKTYEATATLKVVA